MERQEIRIVIVMGTANPIVISSTAGENNRVPFEKPVDVLEAMLQHIRMAQYHLMYVPVFQIR